MTGETAPKAPRPPMMLVYGYIAAFRHLQKLHMICIMVLMVVLEVWYEIVPEQVFYVCPAERIRGVYCHPAYF